MNRYFHYAFILLSLALLGTQPANAQNEDEFFVPPHPVTTIHESVQNSEAPLRVKDSAETKSSESLPVTLPANEHSAPVNVSGSDSLQVSPSVKTGIVPESKLQVQSTKKELKTSTSKQSVASVKTVVPAYQDLFDIYSGLMQVKNGASLDKGALNKLEQLCSQEPDNDIYTRAYAAHVKARGALVASGRGNLSERLVKSAERDLEFVDNWLKIYGRRNTVHGLIEPAWLHGRVDAASQAVLALCLLENYRPKAERRDKIAKLADGLVTAMRPDTKQYPYGAHLSYVTEDNRERTYKVPQEDKKVAGITLYPERQYASMALAKAAQILKNDDFKASAEKEGMGLLAKLALSGKVPYCLAPRPEEEVRSILGTVAIVENLLALKDCTGNNIYGTLAGCAAVDINKFDDHGHNVKAKSLVNYLLSTHGCSEWIGAKDICRPFAGTNVELEAGKAVEKAFDVADINYPGGTPGQFVVVGRDNMFWMRFDVERNDPYYFSMDFLKSSFSGALVSIMVRIDGDQIFRVNLGGATDDPCVDSVFINGPRPLRQGPHSVGVRFAGLLMKSPAILDSIVVDPAISRRWVKLSDGRARMVMHSISDQVIKTRMQELEEKGAESPIWTLIEGTGTPAVKQLSNDRRGHAWLEMPVGGTAVLEWSNGRIPNLVLDED